MKQRNPSINAPVVLAFVTVLTVGYAQGIRADDTEGERFQALKKALAATANDSPGNSRFGISVVDVTTGEEIYSKNGDDPFNPASNAKIITAACALKILGPDYRYMTGLYGRADGTVIRGPVYVKGRGDPTLSTAELYTMVRALASSGIRRVEGGVVVDDTFFDAENDPFAYDQQPNEDAAFRAPVGAASVNHNSVSITIRPGGQPGGPAGVTVDPKGYAVLQNDSVTTLEGSHNPKISAVSMENRTKVRVWGSVPVGSRPVTYTRRADNPSLLLGNSLKAVLEAAGITVGGTVQTGPLPPGAPLIARHASEPLSIILYEAGKMSNNFVTETALKTIGAESGKAPGTWASALEAAGKQLAEWGLEPKTYVYRNGSGLFDANRFSPKQFTAVLRAAYLDATVRPEFVSQLAVGGVDGTVESRYRDPAAKGMVRAKTGTLNDVSTLSGYVFDRNGARPLAFSILVNDAAGYVSASRAFQEKIVTAIAKFLNK